MICPPPGDREEKLEAAAWAIAAALVEVGRMAAAEDAVVSLCQPPPGVEGKPYFLATDPEGRVVAHLGYFAYDPGEGEITLFTADDGDGRRLAGTPRVVLAQRRVDLRRHPDPFYLA